MGLRVIITKLNHPLFFAESKRHRYLDCPRYEKCLNKAINKNWKSFSCAKCPWFKNYLKEERIIKKFMKKFKRSSPVLKGQIDGKRIVEF